LRAVYSPGSPSAVVQHGRRYPVREVAEHERKQITRLIKEQEPKVSNRQIAKLVGADEKTVRRDLRTRAEKGHQEQWAK